jgi:hypothetical protein
VDFFLGPTRPISLHRHQKDRRKGSPEIQGICNGALFKRWGGVESREVIKSECGMNLPLALPDYTRLDSVTDSPTF